MSDGRNGVERLYQSLAWFQWWRRRLAFARAGERLAMHKRLAAPGQPDGAPAGQDQLAEWLVRQLPQVPRSVLEVGCGFGAIALAFARAGAGEVRGITSCRYQAERARAQARALGWAARCEFRCQDLRDPLPQRYEAIVSVETLVHVPELPAVIAHLAAALQPGGRLLLLEDMGTRAELLQDPDGQELCARWHGGRLHLHEEFVQAVASSGLTVTRELDLSAQVALRTLAARRRAERRFTRLHRFAGNTRLRDVADAFLGGFAMERLYACGLLSYRLLLAEAPA